MHGFSHTFAFNWFIHVFDCTNYYYSEIPDEKMNDNKKMFDEFG